jgi:tRNA(adenine34) deaminase
VSLWSEFDARCMALALEAADTAAACGEVPVGAVIASAHGEGQKIIAVAANSPIGQCDPTAHAEIVALRAAAQHIGNYRLTGCTLYVTLEPCTMCCGALAHARIERLVFAAREPKAGAVCSTAQVLDHEALNHRVSWQEGLMAEDSSALLRQFFRSRRQSS